jgi:hypothetical protein
MIMKEHFLEPFKLRSRIKASLCMGELQMNNGGIPNNPSDLQYSASNNELSFLCIHFLSLLLLDKHLFCFSQDLI